MFDSARAAKANLHKLQAHEAVYGRFSLLDRSAPEIVGYEREMKRQGLPSRYEPSHGA
jgi:hypothetical protein